MADYTRREVTTVRVEYVLPNPTNATEYEKAMAGLLAEVNAAGVEYSDDLVSIDGTDEGIVLSYVKENRGIQSV